LLLLKLGNEAEDLKNSDLIVKYQDGVIVSSVINKKIDIKKELMEIGQAKLKIA
jgi:hypothetical protein